MKRKRTISTMLIFLLMISLTFANLDTATYANSEPIDVAQVSCGYYHTGILTINGSLWMSGTCIGDGTTVGKSTPVKIMEDIKQVSCGCNHTGMLKNDGSLWMTGNNAFGQLGDGTTEERLTPVKIMDGVKSVSCGSDHTGILKNDGSLWMTGHNPSGQLGDGTTEGKSAPVKIMDGVKEVSCGCKHTGILKNDGSLWITGEILSDGDAPEQNTTPVKIMDGVKEVSCGYAHTGILKNNGSLWMIGYNRYGQLGDGSVRNKNTPVRIMDGVKSVSCGGYHTGILKNDGSLWMTGLNMYGQFGDGTTENKSTPKKIMDGAKEVSCGLFHTGILAINGSLWMTGHNAFGELGDGTTEDKFAPVKIISGIYNLRDETYSFKNYSDKHSNGHCFGMSMTSSGYYLGLLNRTDIIGGNSLKSLYSFKDTKKVKDPICMYQYIQGSYSKKAIVAGGSWYLSDDDYFDIDSDWDEVVNYVRSHDYDNSGALQIGLREENEGGHSVNFLYYKEVNGQQRLYIYDNNDPFNENYLYKTDYGVLEAPYETFEGSIDCIALRDISKYFQNTKSYNRARCIYAKDRVLSVIGKVALSLMEVGQTQDELVMYELSDSTDKVSMVPNTDNATFIYMNEEYDFGKIDEDTSAVLYLDDVNTEGNDAKLLVTDGQGNTEEVYGTPLDQEEQPSDPADPTGDSTDPSVQPAGSTDDSINPALDPARSEITDLPAVKISKPKAAKRSATIKWKKVSKKNLKKIKKVQVQYSMDRTFTTGVKTKTVNAKKTSIKIKGLKSRKKYYVRIRAYIASGGTVHVSKWSGVKPVKAK